MRCRFQILPAQPLCLRPEAYASGLFAFTGRISTSWVPLGDRLRQRCCRARAHGRRSGVSTLTILSDSSCRPTHLSGTDWLVESNLTPPQASLLEALQRRADRGEPGPTYRELCAEFGWSSTGTARDHLNVLARKGYVVLGGGRARQVRLQEARPLVRQVRVLGHVVAGKPETAEESHDDGSLSVLSDWIDVTPHFALHVRGDSMEGAAILEGDLVLVREQRTAQDGDIVVAAVDGETTLKRLRIRADGVWLVPENSKYKAIRSDEPLIQGVVVGVLRGVPSQLAKAPGRKVVGNFGRLPRGKRTKESRYESVE